MKDQSKWLNYIESQIGFILPSSQLHWLENAVVATATKHHSTVDELWVAVQTNNFVKTDLLDAVLITESRFFRHKPSIDFVKKQAEQWCENSNNTLDHLEKKFRIWSVGCSSGQEAWSLTMNLAAANIDKFHILATDINSIALEAAKKAIYPKRYLNDIPDNCLKFVKNTEQNINRNNIFTVENDKRKVAEELRSHVSFFLHNIFLMDTESVIVPQYFQVQYDIIYCQNMLIYFRQFDQRDILSKLVAQCNLGGYIVLAPNEACFWNHPNMRRIDSEQINAWQRVK